ncbi:hypothetical protein DM860_016890 [Cuscuta australis]|uniref:L-ascorbate oxidase n=1 Tax=Cuscuta australis TaxID=267555 RepID=A0A328E1U6_9ASTE|nr:hypothetical protein DM860_016890 [Cuscuta australis]
MPPPRSAPPPVSLQLLVAAAATAALFFGFFVQAEDGYDVHTWSVTYGDISPLGVPQQGILINGLFPGPEIRNVTNTNVIINVYNNLDEGFLLSWNGVINRGNPYQDGMSGTNCPIPPGQNFTYKLQLKDQIGTFFYFPSLAFHKAAGGFGPIAILNRSVIPLPFPPPADEFTFLIGDWYNATHSALKGILDEGGNVDGGQNKSLLPPPDAILINGNGPKGLNNDSGWNFTLEAGKTYRLRISNVGLESSLNFRIQGHAMTLVEVEGTYTQQKVLSSIDVHAGQSYSVLVTADQTPKAYYVVVSSRFARSNLTATATLRYNGTDLSAAPVGPIPEAPPALDINSAMASSLNDIRTNLTASGARPNAQGTFHYGTINVTRTITLANSAGPVAGKLRYAVNGGSYVGPTDGTPLQLADDFGIPNVYVPGNMPNDSSIAGPVRTDTFVMNADYRDFFEVVFQNDEDTMQTWHFNGITFFVVGMGANKWTNASRNSYNLNDAISRSTTQVYPNSWTAVLVYLSNGGMWNVRSEVWARQYLGQQFYLRVFMTYPFPKEKRPVPDNVIRCGRAINRFAPPPPLTPPARSPAPTPICPRPLP